MDDDEEVVAPFTAFRCISRFFYLDECARAGGKRSNCRRQEMRFDPSAGAKRSMWTKQKTAVGGALSEKIHIFETAEDYFDDES